MFQLDPDASIHLTLGGSVGVLLIKMLHDAFRPKKNGSGPELTILAENAKIQTNILNQQTVILQQMNERIALVLDRTK